MTYIRIAISFVILYFLLSKYGVAAYVSLKPVFTIKAMPFLLLALTFQFTDKLLRVFNFRRLLMAGGQSIKFGSLLRLTLISSFFGFFLPGSSGPDLVRIYKLRGILGGLAEPSASTLLLNMASIFSASILTGISVAIVYFGGLAFNQELLIMALVFSATVFGFACLAYTNRFQLMLHYLVNLEFGRVVAPIARFSRRLLAMVEQRISLPQVAAVTTISLAGLIAACLRTYFLSASLGLDVNVVYYLILVPMVVLITIMPITFAGIGLREASFVFFLQSIGVQEGSALSVGLLTSAINLTFPLLGGVIVLWSSLIKLSRI